MRKAKPDEIEEIQSFAGSAWKVGFMPREQLRASAWIARHFKHGPNSESFDLERFPWLIEPLDAMPDYRIEEQLLICPPQVGKSLGAEGGMCYFIVEDPGDLVAYTHTIALAKMWSEQRVMPSIKKCAPVRPYLPLDPKKFRVLEILMSHMVLEVAPANETQTQSRSRRLVICDERSLWEAGRYDNAKRRASSPNYDGRRKIISFSNSGYYESDVEIQWRNSDQRVLFSKCPACSRESPYKWIEKKCRRVPATIPGFTVHFDENPTTRPGGIWDIDKVVETVRLVCPHCHADFKDTPKVRVQLRRGMKYVPLNPLASIKNRAWAISGVACYPWADLTKQFINATQELDLGDAKAMAEFIMRGINEPWSEDVIFDTTTNTTGDYEGTGEVWSESDCAAMTIDVQALAPYFWFVIRDYAAGKGSRLRKCGPAQSWEELRDLQHKENLPDRFVHVDVTFDSAEVYKRCAQYGWIALRGRPEDSFSHSVVDPNTKKAIQVRRYFSEARYIDPAIGTDQMSNSRRNRALEFMWADTPVKDILSRQYGGLGGYFGIPKDVAPYYLNQMASERKMVVETRGNKEVRRWVRLGKRPNHLWDCEAMQIVFALVKGLLRPGPAAEPPPPS